MFLILGGSVGKHAIDILNRNGAMICNYHKLKKEPS